MAAKGGGSAKFDDIAFIEAEPWRVLIADADASARADIAHAVLSHSSGARVIEAASGQEALAAIEGAAVDIVFLDLGLPDINGVDVVERSRSRGRMPFFVAVSTTADGEQVARLRRLAAYDFLVKPFAAADVGRVLAIYERVTARMRLLVADPSRTQGQIIGRLLTRSVFRFSVSIVGDGLAAIEAYAARPTDLIFLDVDLPGVGGPDVLHILRLYHREVRAVLMSNRQERLDAQPSTLEAARIRKPFLARELEALLHAVLDLPKPYGHFPEH